MTIETYCNNCNNTISTLLILAGPLRLDNTLSVALEEGAMTCIECTDENVSLRLIGGTAKFGNTAQKETTP